MRKLNSKFSTKFISEEGTKLQNRDYFGFVELDEFACYVAADSLDDDKDINSAMRVVECIIRDFTAHPSMSRRSMKAYIRVADQELKSKREGMRLKASLTIVLTDYMKVRYCTVGNSRFYLLREDYFHLKSKDQSLTRNLVDTNEISQDKAALHEERNNLYSYLGQTDPLKLEISKKTVLKDGDIFQIFTRGIWEHCDDGELLDASKDAKETQEILDNVEELILSKQPEKIDNYTLAVTFIDKAYQKPKGRFSIKKLLLILIPLLIVVITIGVVFFISLQNKAKLATSLEVNMQSGERYLELNNYNKARDDYKEALTAAKSLNKTKEQQEIDAVLKLVDQIILGDSYLQEQSYENAMNTYLDALVLSYQADNMGKSYIEEQLEKVRKYIEVYDLIDEGENKESYDDLAGAREAYVKAKQIAAGLYFNDGKQEAIDKIAAIDQTLAERQKDAAAAGAAAQDKQAQEAEDEQQQVEDAAKAKQEAEAAAAKAAEEAAKARQEALQAAIDEQVKAATVQQELDNQARLNEQKNAIEIENLGNTYYQQKDYATAGTYYETARTIYSYLGMTEKVAQLDQKIASALALGSQTES